MSTQSKAQKLMIYLIGRCQLVFLDGRISPGLTELLLPRYEGSSVYCNYLRPLLMIVLKVKHIYGSIALTNSLRFALFGC